MRRTILWGITCLLLVCLLCGCTNQTETEPPTLKYTVTYIVGDTVYATQQVEAGRHPTVQRAQIEGTTFQGWINAEGELIDPRAVAVHGNISYVAKLQATLSEHMPYMELDAHGMFRPDDLLTWQEVRYGLECLSQESAWHLLPELPQGNTVPREDLMQVLYNFFPKADVDRVAPVEAEEVLTRAGFSRCMHILLGRQYRERFVLGAGETIPLDVFAQREDKVALLEACLRHTPDEEGIGWEDLDLVTGWEPGFNVNEGRLYYVREDGHLLRNDYVGDLFFGPAGNYTCGDPVLDNQVAGILNRIMTDNPELEGLELLRKVYDHCHKNYKYLRKEAFSFGLTGWEISAAKEMFSTGRGNCYNYAAIFWALARGLGYDVTCLAGTCLEDEQPHGWVGLEYEGKKYFIDPEWQYAYTERGEFDKDMFMLTMDQVWWWTYRWDRSQF